MPYINFISAEISLPNATSFLSFFAMDSITRNPLSVWLLVPCQPVLLEPFEVLYGLIQCDRMQNELWGSSATTF